MSKIYTLKELDFNELFNKYPKDKLVLGIGAKTMYFIPPELVIDQYETDKIWVFNYLWTDGLGNYSNWLNRRDFRRILDATCHIDLQIYYDLFYLNIIDTEERPKCSNCGTPMIFGGILYYGYSNNGYSFYKDDNHFCSRYCYHQFKSTHPEVYVDSMALTAYKEFMDKGDPNDICDFYIAITDNNKFKYGVSNDANDRSDMFSQYHYNNIKVILRDTRLNLALLEYNIKQYLADYHEEIELSRISDFRSAFYKSTHDTDRPSDYM